MRASTKVFVGSLKAKLVAGLTLSLLISVLALSLVARNLNELRDMVARFGSQALPALIDGFALERAMSSLSLRVTDFLLCEERAECDGVDQALGQEVMAMRAGLAPLADTDPRRALMEKLLVRIDLARGLVAQRLALKQQWQAQGEEIAARWERLNAIISPYISGLSVYQRNQLSVQLLLDIKSQLQEAIGYLRLVALADGSRIDVLEARTLANLSRVRYRITHLDDSGARGALLAEVDQLEAIARGAANPFAARHRELLVERNLERFGAELGALTARMQALNQDANNTLSQSLRAQSRAGAALTERTLYVLIAMALLSTAAFAGLAFWVVGPLVGRRVSSLATALREISAGQLDRPVQVGGEDELVELARGVELLRRSLVSQQRFQRELAVERQRADHMANESRLVLEEARSRQHFLATMSHEVRTPLNGVIGLLDICLGSDIDPQQREYLRTAQSAANQLLTVVNDLLEFSRLESGTIELEQRPVDIDQLSTDLQRFFDPVRKPDVVFSVQVDPDVPRPFLGDPTRIQQILHNLLSNAFKFTARGRVGLRIGCADGGRTLRIEVSDTGIGMDGDKLNQVFDAYRQADSSITRRFGGTGLGLAIVRHLVTVMGGRVEVESEPGKGSHFLVSLPLTSTTGALPSAAPPPAAAAPAPMTVLVVEDNPTNQLVVRTMLQRWGCTVEVAENGRQAVAAYQRQPGHFDLLLMDCEMPELDGYGATREIRQFEKASGLRRCPIVGLSAHALEEYRNAALAAGMDDYLTKPIVSDALARALTRLQAKKHPA
ncbi:MAG: ATP-binding protein [Spongiibacteraceae bacterium]|jgi:signal transduction histidine kinase/CheY-like chemotaxis protein|nr:ATP-binding protein [Spongiibacteraceae bacterium]